MLIVDIAGICFGFYRKRLPLYECLLLELRESGYVESADYLQDLIYDNMQLIAEDDIGIIVDIRTRDDYISEIAGGLKQAENEKERGHYILSMSSIISSKNLIKTITYSFL